ncbi:MAG: recombinase family protein [Clostridiales bacterium]|nr:recombinase family protein [Clostridiales bacterium]
MTQSTQNETFRPAIAYYRYSSHRQGEQSIEGQRTEANRWATANGYTIIKEYADRAMTGTNDDREQFQLMLREVERIHAEVLILWKVDRMGRNKEEIAINKYKLKKNNVKVAYTAEHIPDTPEGVILESILEGMAEYYSLQLSQNIRRGQRVSASKCQSTGGNRPLGYLTGPDKKFIIDPEYAPVIRQIFELYANGATRAEVAKILNAQGFRTLKNKPFTINSLDSILKNEKYIGIYNYNDEIRIEGGVPAIIDETTFKRVQEMMKMNKRAPSRTWAKIDYILTDKLFCGKCGAYMAGYSGTSHSGRKHNYYSCNNQRKKKCDKKIIRKSWIEDIVLHETKRLLFDDILLDFIAENTYNYYTEANTDTSYTKALASGLKETETAMSNLIRAIEAGIFNEDTKKRMSELDEQKRQILASIERSKLQTGLLLTKDHILYFLKRFRELDIEDIEAQKRLVSTFINAVFVYDDNVKLTFNYSGDNRIITLQEVDAAMKGEKFVSIGYGRGDRI